LALWDCDRGVEVLQDLALDDPRVMRRFQVEMTKRHINVATAPESACTICTRRA
jgi:hypothetical protein